MSPNHLPEVVYRGSFGPFLSGKDKLFSGLRPQSDMRWGLERAWYLFINWNSDWGRNCAMHLSQIHCTFWHDVILIYLYLYDKLNFTHILTGSYLCSIREYMQRWHCNQQKFAFLRYKTIIFHVAIRLFCYRSQETLKCRRNKWLGLVCYSFALTTFWHHLWSFTEQTLVSNSKIGQKCQK